MKLPQVAIVKAGPHKKPWAQYPEDMDMELPEGHIVLVSELITYTNPDLVLVYNHIADSFGWCVHKDSLIFLGDL